MSLTAWNLWLILGIVFIIIEIFDPSFFFVSLGIGAIITSLIALLPFVSKNLVIQILVFALSSFIAFLFMRKLGKKVLKDSGPQTNVYALIGQRGTITKAILKGERGYVKVGGEEWVAVAMDNKSFELNAKVTIAAIDGNKLIVKDPDDEFTDE